MDLLKNYIKNFVVFDLLSKNPINNNVIKLPKIKSCIIQISLKLSNEYSLVITDSFLFLEWLTGQRPLLKKVGFLYKNYKPLLHLVLSVTLRNFFLENFFHYILICANLTKKKSIYINTNLNLELKKYYITITDVNFFFNIPEFLYKFSESVSIVFEFDNLNSEEVQLFISSFSDFYFNSNLKKNNEIFKNKKH